MNFEIDISEMEQEPVLSYVTIDQYKLAHKHVILLTVYAEKI